MKKLFLTLFFLMSITTQSQTVIQKVLNELSKQITEKNNDILLNDSALNYLSDMKKFVPELKITSKATPLLLNGVLIGYDLKYTPESENYKVHLHLDGDIELYLSDAQNNYISLYAHNYDTQIIVNKESFISNIHYIEVLVNGKQYYSVENK